jgi:hypothetical protein
MGHSDRLCRTLLGLAVLAHAACDSNKPPSTAAPTPTSPVVAAVAITGVPSAMTVGQTAQLTASVTLTDGTRLDATGTASWQSSTPSVATVSTAGLLTVVGFGEADVVATVQTVRGTAHLSVTRPAAPTPRFDIAGVVHESVPTDSVAVAGATVGIHFVGCPTCPHDNQTATTDSAGRFTLAGIETGGFVLFVSKPGYDMTEYAVAQLPRDASPDIALNPTGRCSYVVKPEINDTHSEDTVTGAFAVITPAYCSWTAAVLPTGFYDGRTYYYDGVSGRFSPASGTGPATVTYTANSTEGDRIVEGIRISGLSGVNPAAQHTIIMAGR